jgi:hypothetical protein
LFVLGDCDALYESDGLPTTAVKRTSWNPVEGSAVVGWFDIDVTFPAQPAGTVVPILATGRPGDVVVAEYVDGGRLRFQHWTADGSRTIGRPIRVATGGIHRLRLLVDWRIERLTVRLGDRVVVEDLIASEAATLVLGTSGGAAGVLDRFPGALVARPIATPLCGRLLDQAR